MQVLIISGKRQAQNIANRLLAKDKFRMMFRAAICEKLNMAFHTIDLRQEYKSHVIHYFRDEYLKGKTPNHVLSATRNSSLVSS